MVLLALRRLRLLSLEQRVPPLGDRVLHTAVHAVALLQHRVLRPIRAMRELLFVVRLRTVLELLAGLVDEVAEVGAIATVCCVRGRLAALLLVPLITLLRIALVGLLVICLGGVLLGRLIPLFASHRGG